MDGNLDLSRGVGKGPSKEMVNNNSFAAKQLNIECNIYAILSDYTNYSVPVIKSVPYKW